MKKPSQTPSMLYYNKGNQKKNSHKKGVKMGYLPGLKHLLTFRLDEPTVKYLSHSQFHSCKCFSEIFKFLEWDGGTGIDRVLFIKARYERTAGVPKGGVLKSIDFE